MILMLTELFEKEQEDLPSELKDIPKKACDRRVSFEFLELIKLQFCYIFLISIKVPSLFL
ncbi:hypothetical protein HanLR1_Chr04g0120161 [Helianthus annuus]|nr:hypothetical protein HanLR1_Chr04g0120161 [Helianthus annuus]